MHAWSKHYKQSCDPVKVSHKILFVSKLLNWHKERQEFESTKVPSQVGDSTIFISAEQQNTVSSAHFKFSLMAPCDSCPRPLLNDQ